MQKIRTSDAQTSRCSAARFRKAFGGHRDIAFLRRTSRSFLHWSVGFVGLALTSLTLTGCVASRLLQPEVPETVASSAVDFEQRTISPARCLGNVLQALQLVPTMPVGITSIPNQSGAPVGDSLNTQAAAANYDARELVYAALSKIGLAHVAAAEGDRDPVVSTVISGALVSKTSSVHSDSSTLGGDLRSNQRVLALARSSQLEITDFFYRLRASEGGGQFKDLSVEIRVTQVRRAGSSALSLELTWLKISNAQERSASGFPHRQAADAFETAVTYLLSRRFAVVGSNACLPRELTRAPNDSLAARLADRYRALTKTEQALEFQRTLRASQVDAKATAKFDDQLLRLLREKAAELKFALPEDAAPPEMVGLFVAYALAIDGGKFLPVPGVDLSLAFVVLSATSIVDFYIGETYVGSGRNLKQAVTPGEHDVTARVAPGFEYRSRVTAGPAVPANVMVSSPPSGLVRVLLTDPSRQARVAGVAIDSSQTTLALKPGRYQANCGTRSETVRIAVGATSDFRC